MRRLAGYGIFIAFFLALSRIEAQSQDSIDPPAEPGITVDVVAPHVPESQAAEVISSPASILQFDPTVDLQTRNSSVVQGDVTIRGGTFENSGFSLGAAGIFDPQTGHYHAQLPVSPMMLSSPQAVTGFENALHSFNAAAGSVRYQYQPIRRTSATAKTGAGDYRTSQQQAYLSAAKISDSDAGALNMDLEYARSGSQGTRIDGDHNLDRVAGRIQWLGSSAQTDLVAGYESKNYSWPYLYAPRELHEFLQSSGIESEELSTALYQLNHRQLYGEGSHFEFSPYYRRNHDDYEFDRFNPGLFNPYRHTTEVISAAFQGLHLSHPVQLRYSFQVSEDHLRSSALNYGDFHSRIYGHSAVVPGRRVPLSERTSLLIEAGAALNGTNREGARISPLIQLTVEDDRGRNVQNKYYFQIAQTSQTAGYTALASNPDAGLFRGNPDLDRTVSTNYEAGLVLKRKTATIHGALFYRYDKDLVDWTYDSQLASSVARSANNVNLRTAGFEAVAKKSLAALDATLGYTILQKWDEYETSSADASFYSLNYPNQRVVAAVILHAGDQVTFRLDGELRREEPNLLRGSRNRNYFLSSASMTWHISNLPEFDISVLIDNIGNQNFEEVPGVPGPGRLALATTSWSW